MTAEIARRIVDDYRRARVADDYPAQAGILVSLLQTLAQNESSPAVEIAKETAQAILLVRDQTS